MEHFSKHFTKHLTQQIVIIINKICRRCFDNSQLVPWVVLGLLSFGVIGSCSAQTTLKTNPQTTNNPNEQLPDFSAASQDLTPDEYPTLFTASIGKPTIVATNQDKNIDPENESIVITKVMTVSFRGQQFKLNNGATASAKRFLTFLENTPQLAGQFSGKHILELGSGTGLVGMALVNLGATVDFTDQAPMMPLLEKSVSQNLSPSQLTRTRFHELLWGQTHKSAFLRNADYNVIIASDVVYAKEAIDPLIQTISEFGGGNAQVYLAYVHRFPWEKSFFEKMGKTHSRTLLTKMGSTWIFKFTPLDKATSGQIPYLPGTYCICPCVDCAYRWDKGRLFFL